MNAFELTTELQEKPLGLGTGNPRFSWKVEPEPGRRGRAIRVESRRGARLGLLVGELAFGRRDDRGLNVCVRADRGVRIRRIRRIVRWRKSCV